MLGSRVPPFIPESSQWNGRPFYLLLHVQTGERSEIESDPGLLLIFHLLCFLIEKSSTCQCLLPIANTASKPAGDGIETEVLVLDLLLNHKLFGRHFIPMVSTGHFMNNCHKIGVVRVVILAGIAVKFK